MPNEATNENEGILRPLDLLTAQVWKMGQQLERLEDRLAYAMPTDADVRNEVDRFITSALRGRPLSA